MEKFQNKYRIQSARLQNYDYGSSNAYFITICTQHRLHYFGEVVKEEMQLNELGRIVETEWLKTIELRADMNLQLGEFIVMPNHFHAIIFIGENEYNTCTDALNASQAQQAAVPKNTFGAQSKNLASIVRGFKAAVTKNIRVLNADFMWQSRFHDHIIRNEKSYQNISNYIASNPANWKKDTHNT
jgi:REP element-mobilizing transposase RayT